MQYHSVPCNTMQYHAIPHSTMTYRAVPCNTMHYHAIPCNTVQYCAIPCQTMQYNAGPCNIMQYHGIPWNTMQYHASWITAVGAYHCPVGSSMVIFSIGHIFTILTIKSFLSRKKIFIETSAIGNHWWLLSSSSLLWRCYITHVRFESPAKSGITYTSRSGPTIYKLLTGKFCPRQILFITPTMYEAWEDTKWGWRLLSTVPSSHFKKSYRVNMIGRLAGDWNAQSNQISFQCVDIFCFHLFAFLAQFKGLFQSLSDLETEPVSPSLRLG